MAIVRSPQQSDETIEEFYQRDNWLGLTRKVSERTLEFIERVNKLFPETILYVSTSHQRLCFHEAGEKELNWVIIVAYSLIDTCNVSFKVPEDKSPWKDAWTNGECTSLDTVIQYFLIAMKETGYWNENPELNSASEELLS